MFYLGRNVLKDVVQLLRHQVDQFDRRLPQPADLALAHLVKRAVGGEQAYPYA